MPSSLSLSSSSCVLGSSSLLRLWMLVAVIVQAKEKAQQSPEETIVFRADFNTDTNGFIYRGDTFRGTQQIFNQNPRQANATTTTGGQWRQQQHQQQQGWLQVTLMGGGGVNVVDEDDNDNNNDDKTILVDHGGGMSGGWERTFPIDGLRHESNEVVMLSLRYRLSHHHPADDSSTHEQTDDEEYLMTSQALVSVNGHLVGQEPYNVVAQLVSGGSHEETAAGPTSTGWKTFRARLDYHRFFFNQQPGKTTTMTTHSIILGGYSRRSHPKTHTTANRKTITTIEFDNVVLSLTKRPVATSSSIGMDNSPTAKQAAARPPFASPEQEVVNRLDLQRFKDTIATLARFGDRRQGSSSYRMADAWVESRLRAFGYPEVERARYRYRGQRRDSMYVTKIGTTFPDRMYIVSAHLDGRGRGGAADDDASGCSLVLEMARVFANNNVNVEMSVRFVFWNNEETGLVGSSAYVNQRARRQGQEDPPNSGRYPEPTWLGMIQHDMILFDHGLPPRRNQIENADCDIEYQESSRFAALSRQLAEALYRGNLRYARYYPAQVTNDMSNTDSVPFMDLAPSVSFRENRRLAEIGQGANPHWHQPTDVYATYSEEDFLFGFNILQTTTGTVAELVGLSITPN